MKRLIKYILLVAFVAAVSVSCDEDSTGDISRVTHFPEFNIQGDNPYFIDMNSGVSSYEDPGVVVTEGEEEIDYQMQENVDVSSAGYYSVTYTATNKDGYSASENRTVIVGTQDDLNATLSATGKAESSLGFTFDVTIEKVGIGKFAISEISGAFGSTINGEVGILNQQVVTGSSAYGMYDSATLDLDNNQLIIEWSYAYYGFDETTTIPISYEVGA